MYIGSQIPEKSITITFKIHTFNKSTFKVVEELLIGFGGFIR